MRVFSCDRCGQVVPFVAQRCDACGAALQRFGGELFPNVIEAQSGLTFAEFFQNDRDTSRKGIVLINVSEGEAP